MQRTDWNGLSADEKDSFVSSLVEYGTDFVAPLYSVVEKIEETLQEKNSTIRAQADARPLAWYDRATGNVYPLLGEGERYAAGVRQLEPLYNHPEASAPGLSEPAFWISKSDADWLERVPNVNGQIQALRLGGASRVPVFLTRASAATVAEPTVVRGVRVCSISDIECTKQCGAICHHEATQQQQAEPGADDRAEKPVAYQYEIATAIQHGGHYSHWEERITKGKPNVPAGSVRNLIPLYARAAQSGQRAGVALLDRIRQLATEGMCHGLLADDKCREILEALDGNAIEMMDTSSQKQRTVIYACPVCNATLERKE